MITDRLPIFLVIILFIGLTGCSPIEPLSSSEESTAEESSPESGSSQSALDEAIASTVAKLEGQNLAKYEAALAAEPLPRQDELITGEFHGEFIDGEFDSYYVYERRSDGKATQTTVDLFHEDQQYLQDEFTYPWKSKGRVIYEGDQEDPGLVYIMLLEEVTEEKISYRMLDLGNGPTDLEVAEDLRGPGNLPDVPEGWTVVDD